MVNEKENGQEQRVSWAVKGKEKEVGIVLGSQDLSLPSFSCVSAVSNADSETRQLLQQTSPVAVAVPVSVVMQMQQVVIAAPTEVAQAPSGRKVLGVSDKLLSIPELFSFLSSKKIISVVIALHLGSLLPSIICEDQYAFLKDWSITDNILLALELTQSINRKTPGGNLTLKLDLQKDFE
ncbi:hypothetical protein M9H77_27179 [Catharanthus roseus]|uniref:Uncharacterized protein n=1 Tax=Catharanthus roseus TaxID=4058 RepID=A0ACC0ACS5_CATRO|nr:hypothetical protein M9H77_27179 [Catharanthus roseus]